MINKNKKGVLTFSIPPVDWLEKDLLKEIFSRFYPTHIEHKFNRTEYYGYSEYFDEVEKGCIIPEYVAEIKTDAEGIFESIKFIKQ